VDCFEAFSCHTQVCLHDQQLCRCLALTLTAQRDQQSLTDCLVRWLDRLPLAERVTVYRLVGSNPEDCTAEGWCLEAVSRPGAGHGLVPAAEVEGVVACLEQAGPLEIVLNGGMPRFIQPIRGLGSADLLLVFDGFVGSDEARRFLADFADLVSNLNQLHAQSERDALTRLFNRQVFDRKLGQIQQDLSRAERRNGEPDAGHFLALIDVDHFKRINDTHGHLYGDEVLIGLAGLMQRTFRHSDYLFRYGGEEFAAILTRIHRDRAESVLERLRRQVAETLFPQIGGITVSIGYARIEPGVPGKIIERADRALYFCKNNGRNRIAEYSALVKMNLLREELPTSDDIELF
jgi:diguanylate cyclase (GGDEF)-like protein